MHQANRILILAIILLIATPAFSQNTPKSLLWRISGKGLTKPSYLFGTMHLTDKRLFNFTDSVYQSIENTEGFALEVDFREYMDSLFMSGLEEAEDRLLESQTVQLDNRLLDKGADSLLKQFGIEGGSVNKKQLKKIRDHRMAKIIQGGEMETIVDGFLYGIALKSGKWIGAVEDVSDQLNLSDELGGQLSPEQVFIPEKSMRSSIESMIKVYLKQDLDAIDKMSNGYSKEFKDAYLTNRNKKMAGRIDSLTAIRSMFIAVGAAHLGGEDGLIQLLIKKGFRVEPVMSDKTIAGSQYIKKFAALPWHTISNEELPYSVSMPGKPSDYDVFGQAFKIKMMFDITTMGFYMAGHAIAPGMEEERIKNAFEMVTSGKSGQKIKPVVKREADYISYEGSFTNESGGYRVKVLYAMDHIYLLMAGTSKVSGVNHADVTRYFESFQPISVQYKKTESVDFTIPGKAFTIRFPGTPQKNSAIDRQHAGNPEWEVNTYDFLDNRSQKYYMLQVKDISAGNYISSDSVYFEEFQKEIGNTMKVTKNELVSFENYPALQLEAIYEDNILYKTLSIIRGGRIYFMMVGGSMEEMNKVDSFMLSFKLEAYPQTTWNRQDGPGFYTTSPAAIISGKGKNDKKASGQQAEAEEPDSDDDFESYYSYQKEEALTYTVIKTSVSPYYWVKDQEAYFQKMEKIYVEADDELLERKIVKNGNIPSLDLKIKKANSPYIQKVRFFVNGLDLYALVLMIPEAEDGKWVHRNKFFDDFRVLKEAGSVIYTNKAATLMDSLFMGDSVVFARAKEALFDAEFNKGDLPLLHKAALRNYQDSGDYNEVRDHIISEIINLEDRSSVDFVLDQYENYGKENDNYRLLEILAGMHNSHSYSALKSLLAKGAPRGNRTWGFESGLRDSLELTRTLVPEMLANLNDSVFVEAVYDIFTVLLDSNVISLAEITPYKPVFLKHGNYALQSIKSDQQNWYKGQFWLPLISKWNDQENNELIAAYLQIPQLGLKRYAIRALLKNGQTVPSSEILLLAEDSFYRYVLYSDLVQMNKASLMPAAFATQRKMSESELYYYASDDNDIHSISYQGDVLETVEGKQVRFLLFRVDFNTEGGKASYLGVTGPYDVASKEIVADSKIVSIYWDEVFDKAKMKEQFKIFLKGLE